MTERPEHDPHQWPQSTAASLLAGLATTRKADEAERFARLLDEKDALWHPVAKCGCDPATGMHAVTCVFWPLYVARPGSDGAS